MSDASGPSRRGRRIEEAVLEVEGVVAVRIWELRDRIEIGVVTAVADAAGDVLKRVMDVTEALRSPDEVWEVGLLTDGIAELEPGPQ
jgi:hypothetical protein